MKSTMNHCWCILIWSIALAAVAQEIVLDAQSPPDVVDSTQIEGAADDEPAEPKRRPDRELEFEVSDTEVEVKLFRPDPDLLHQKYAAFVEIIVPEPQGRGLREFGLPRPLEDLAWFGQNNLLNPGRRRSDRESMKEFFVRLANVLQGDPAIDGESMSFFLSDAVENGWIMNTGMNFSPGEGTYQFRILAPTEQLARDRAETLVRMLDRAIALPLIEHFQTAMSERAESLETLNPKLAAAEAAAQQLNEQFEDVKESAVDADELKRLTTERRLLDVDLAGIRARIDAAEEIIAKLKGQPRETLRRIEQLEDIKITAEIDLAGLAARRKVLDQMINDGKKREDLAYKLVQSRDALNDLERSERRITSELQEYRDAFIVYSEKLFALKDHKIVIRPIQWIGN